jgi:hypothetical protein
MDVASAASGNSAGRTKEAATFSAASAASSAMRSAIFCSLGSGSSGA